MFRLLPKLCYMENDNVGLLFEMLFHSGLVVSRNDT